MDNTPQWYEAEYNNRARVPEHAEIFARWKASSEQARDALGGELDVAFGEHPLQKLDVFPAKGGSKALLLFIHGGYWRSLDKADFSFVAPELTARGVTVAVNNYRLCPSVGMEDLVRDNLAACAWLWRNARRFGADPARLYVSGHSAGGHLTVMMMAARWPEYGADLPRKVVQGGLAVSGLYDLPPLLHTSINTDLKLTAEAARRLSPEWMPPPTAALLYTCVGGRESDEFKRQNRLIGERWRGVFREDVPAPECNHFTVIDELAKPDGALFKAALRMMRI
jgi:arylformamidase